jgi:hypothetical protein
MVIAWHRRAVKMSQKWPFAEMARFVSMGHPLKFKFIV